MADEKKKKLSIAEIMAAARKADSKSGGETAPSPAPPEAELKPVPEPTPETAPSAEKPAAAAGSRPSIKDILAAARANKGTTEAAPAAAKPAAPKPAAKPAAAAGEAKPAAKPPGAVVKDTASILAAARKGLKPGPITKDEAALKAKDAPPTKPVKPTLVAPPMPAKPEFARPKAAAVGAEPRRTFLGTIFGSALALGMTAVSATAGLWTLGTARFMFPNILTEPPSRFKVGFPTNFAPGQVETKFVAQFGVWVVNYEYQGQQQIYALRTVCTHLGCTPNWLEGEQKFKCPCHGSGFYKDGINFEGPAPRPLERFAIRVSDDGQLEVDKSKLFQEEMGQWADAASFVNV